MLAKSGLNMTTLVACVGAQPLFFAYFCIDSARAPSLRAHQSSFYPHNPTSKLLLCCLLILDVETQAWRGSHFYPSGTHLLDFLVNDPKCTSHQLLGLSTPILLQWCLLITRIPTHQKYTIQCGGWSGVDIWLWKSGFTPRPIRHGVRDGRVSRSGAAEGLQVGLHLDAELEAIPSWRLHPGVLAKSYPFWASDNLLCWIMVCYV